MTIPLSLQEEGDNEETVFDLVAWIKLSKLRCHLAVRHSKDLNYKFQKLFPRTQMEPPVRLRMLQEKATHLAVVKRHYNRYDFVPLSLFVIFFRKSFSKLLLQAPMLVK